MSDSILKLIPVEPEFLPDQKAQERAGELLCLLFRDADDVTINTSEETAFVDQGENFESVHCPVCGAGLQMDWWADAMATAAKDGFFVLGVHLPCCNSMASLNDLQYDWPAGFARFVIEVINPGDDCVIDDQSKQLLESVLGCKLRVVKTHY